MTSRNLTAAAALVASVLLGGCATPPTETAEARQEPVYRTGSNIPVKEGTASRTLTVRPDDTPRSTNMPAPRPGGG